jgi:hypothetical protein
MHAWRIRLRQNMPEEGVTHWSPVGYNTAGIRIGSPRQLRVGSWVSDLVHSRHVCCPGNLQAAPNLPFWAVCTCVCTVCNASSFCLLDLLTRQACVQQQRCVYCWTKWCAFGLCYCVLAWTMSRDRAPSVPDIAGYCSLAVLLRLAGGCYYGSSCTLMYH